MSEIEIVTPHLLGSCVSANNQVHGLFCVAPMNLAPRRLAGKALSPSEAVAAWDLRTVIARVPASA